jgi:type III secretion protein V
VLGVALFLVGRARARSQRAEQQRAATEPTPKERARGVGPGGVGEPTFLPLVVPWSLEVSADLEPLLDAELAPLGGLRAAAIGLREAVFAELGVPLPAPRVRARADLGARLVVLSLFEVPAKVLAVPAELAAPQAQVAWVRERALELLRARAADFLGLAEVQRLLDELEQFAPATVRNVVPKPVTLVLLTDVLRRLVEERISVRDLRAILESLSTVAASEKDPLNLAEYVRSQMRRAITFRLTAGIGQLDVVLLDPVLEDTVRRAVTRTPAGAFLTLPPQAARDVLASMRRALASLPQPAPTQTRQQLHEGGETGALPAVVLTQPDIRRFVRKLIESEMPEVSVVSFAELLPEVALKPVARASP